MRALWIAAAAFALPIGAGAQKVYRCGPDGRIYQQAPCQDGKAIDASDPRTPEQRASAQALAASEASRAAQFDRDNAPASVPEGRKAKPPKAPRAAVGAPPSGAASAPKKNRKSSTHDPSKPQTVRLPTQSKATTAAASP